MIVNVMETHMPLDKWMAWGGIKQSSYMLGIPIANMIPIESWWYLFAQPAQKLFVDIRSPILMSEGARAHAQLRI